MIIPISTEFAADTLYGLLRSVFEEVDIIYNQKIPSLGLSRGLMMIRVKAKDGQSLTSIASADMVLFMWRFEVICPIVSGDQVTFWCSGKDAPSFFPITFHFSLNSEILEKFSWETPDEIESEHVTTPEVIKRGRSAS